MTADRLAELLALLEPHLAAQRAEHTARHGELLAAIQASEERLMMHTAMLKAGLRELATELQVTRAALAAPQDVRHVHVVELEAQRPSGVSAGEHALMQRYRWWTDT